MSQKILITKFRFNLPPQEYKEMLAPLAQSFAEVPGCQWKIWLVDEEKNEGGAIYLFRDQQAMDDFIQSPLVAAVLAHPALSSFELRPCDVLKEISEITRAPLTEMAVA
jgi:quinol monooxygenase YgiN